MGCRWVSIDFGTRTGALVTSLLTVGPSFRLRSLAGPVGRGAARLGGLVLVVVVDRVVPEHGLVTVAPGEVLGADVLVWVLDLLLERSCVLCVLLMSIPSQLSVDAGEHKAGSSNAVDLLACISLCSNMKTAMA